MKKYWKIILNENIVLSLVTEFIENEKKYIDKQDREINVAKYTIGHICLSRKIPRRRNRMRDSIDMGCA